MELSISIGSVSLILCNPDYIGIHGTGRSHFFSVRFYQPKLNFSRHHSERIIIGVCGIPASGKTTLANAVVERINQLHGTHPHAHVLDTETGNNDHSSDIAICVSQDGWHLPRSALDQFEDVELAYNRRGAAFTFDGAAFSAFVLALRSSSKRDEAPPGTAASAALQDGSEAEKPIVPKQAGDNSPPLGNFPAACASFQRIIRAPSFSHTLKDPTPDAIAIYHYHRIVIIEGLYTFLNIHPWSAAAHALDERWFIDVDIEEGKRRLVARHIATGVAKDYEEAVWRAENNDLPSELLLPSLHPFHYNGGRKGDSMFAQQLIFHFSDLNCHRWRIH